jgi:hypothetical protein
MNGIVFPVPVPAITMQSRPSRMASVTSSCQQCGGLPNCCRKQSSSHVQVSCELYLVFAGPVWSGLLPKFGKTETETGPGQSQDCKKPMKTNIDRFMLVLGGLATDKNRSQPVLVKTG